MRNSTGIAYHHGAERLKLPVLQTIRLAYSFLFRNLGHFARLVAVPAIAWLFVTTLFEWLDSQGKELPVLIDWIPDILLAWFALFWHRLYLLGPEPTKQLITGRFMEPGEWRSHPTWRFLRASVLYGILTALMVGLAIGAIIVGAKHTTGTTELPVYSYPLPVVGSFFLSVLFFRVLPIFPAIAVDSRDFGIKAAWHSTQRNGFRFAAIIWLATLPVVVIIFIALMAILTYGTSVDVAAIGSNAVLGLGMFALVAILATCNSQTFLFLSKWKPEAAKPEGQLEARHR